ncbi:MAG: hypothetical protein ACP5P3_06620 [Ignavibacteria bacterium]
MTYSRIVFILFIIITIPLEGTTQDFIKHLQIIPTINYITSATIQLNPFTTDIVEKNSSVELKGGYGYGLIIKQKLFGSGLDIGLGSEYIRIEDNELVETLEEDTSIIRGRVTETVEMIPIELTVYFTLPEVVKNLNIFLGGGGGIYFGDRSRHFANMTTTTEYKRPMPGIIVLVGTEYRVHRNLSVYFEARFRQAGYRVRSTFPRDYVIYQGIPYYFNSVLDSKVFIDGLKLSLGIGVNF